MKRITLPDWTVPIALLLFCILSFGLLIPVVGFYWDDWPTIWQLHVFGPQGYSEAFSVDRPFLAAMFMVTTPFIGESVWGWQLFKIFSLWICSVSLWWSLRQLWPERTAQITWITFIFAIYPSFSQHYIAVTYSHAFLVYAWFLFSFGSMLAAFRNPSSFWTWMILSWISSSTSMFIGEYFFGLELLRPILLWMILGEQALDARERMRKVGRYWLPYILIMAAFLVWRTQLSTTERGQISLIGQLMSDPLLTIRGLISTIFQDLYEVTLLAWGQTINQAHFSFSRQERHLLAAIVAMIVITTIFIFVYLLALKPEDKSHNNEKDNNATKWALQAIFIGVVGLLVGGWPFWTTDLPMMLNFPWDRFTLPMMLGASILVVGLIEMIFRRHVLKILILSVMIGLAVGLHFHTGLDYRKYWNKQRNLLQQLTWRVPGIEPGTVLLTPQLPHLQYSDNSLSAPINWIYAPDKPTRQLDYLVLALETRMGDILSEIGEDVPIHLEDRNLSFDGSTSKMVVFFHEPPRCVTIVEPGIDKWPPKGDWYIKEALELSNPDLIILDPSHPAELPSHIFGVEDKNKWCYYFEKADLARQKGDWSRIPELGDKAYEHLEDLYFVNAPELFPFIQGYALEGKWDEAKEWSIVALELKPNIDTRLCDIWKALLSHTDPSAERQEAIRVIEEQSACQLH